MSSISGDNHEPTKPIAEVEIDQAQQDALDEAQEKREAFRESDIQLARVLEDLISMLIDRDFIRFTDFPEPAQKRLIERQSLRTNNGKLNLLEDDQLN